MKSKISRSHISFSLRRYSFDPFQKGILINKRLAFWSLYGISRYPLAEELQTGEKDVWDYNGWNVNLIEFRHDGTPSEAQGIRSICGWFDAVWGNDELSKEFPPQRSVTITSPQDPGARSRVA